MKDIDLSLYDIKSNITLYPEGGKLLEALKQKVAFKIDNYRLPSEKSNVFLFKDDKLIDTVIVDNNGIGLFQVKPLEQENYFLRNDSYGIDIKIPKPENKGVVLHLTGENEEDYTFELINNGLENYYDFIYIKALSMGKLYYLSKAKIKKGIRSFKIPKKKNLPARIVELSIMDNEFNVISSHFFLPIQRKDLQ